MLETKLYTKQGVFVATVLVAPFLPGCEADVLIWGERFFQRRDDGNYYECFGVVAFTADEMLDW